MFSKRRELSNLNSQITKSFKKGKKFLSTIKIDKKLQDCLYVRREVSFNIK